MGKKNTHDTGAYKGRVRGILAVLLLLAAGPGPAAVYINEFLADNNSGIRDGDGNRSDWIELFNDGTNAVNLAGLYLTDDTNVLTQWQFPSTNLAAGSYLLVFASGAATPGYLDASNNLHTTFKLAKNDTGQHESVLLVQTDGVTITHGYVDYPAQTGDKSYGLAPTMGFSSLIAASHAARATIPTGAIAGWTNAVFDDTGWLSGSLGVGFGPGYAGSIGLNVAAMSNVNATAYARMLFQVPSNTTYSALTLRMKFDDGFIAYVNGREVARSNAPAAATWNSAATRARAGSVTTWDTYSATLAVPHLVAGTNVLAVHVLNMPINSGDLLAYPELTATTISGIDTNSVLFLPTPTPLAGNLTGVLGFVDDTSFSVNRGFFTNAFQVAITCQTAAASIYYTTDGSTPKPGHGTLYSNAVSVASTMVLRAAAHIAGWQPSDTDTHTYFFVNDIVNQPTNPAGWPANSVNGQVLSYGMDRKVTTNALYAALLDDALTAIPAISIVTDQSNLLGAASGIYVNPAQDGLDWERPVSVELISPSNAPGFQINAGLRLRGGMSRQTTNPKHSFRLFFRSEYGDAKLSYPLFGDEGDTVFDKVDLRTAQNYSWNINTWPSYATWLDDPFSRDTQRDLGHPYTRSRWYHLFLNGHYWGLYQTDERAEAAYGESYMGGVDSDYDTLKSDNDRGFVYATDGSIATYSNLWYQLTTSTLTLSNYYRLQGLDTNGVEQSALVKYLDLDNLTDYMLLVFLTANRDMPIGPPGGYTVPRNLYVLYNRVTPRGFQFVAHDCEMSVERPEGVGADRVNWTPGATFNIWSNCTPWWIYLKLMTNTEYKVRVADRIHRHFFNGGAMTAQACSDRWMARATEIDTAIIAESARWGDYLTPATPRTRNADWLPQVQWHVTNYFLATPTSRSDIVLSQLKARGWYPAVAAPVFAQHGGLFSNGFALAISATSAVYYTSDGTDPREPGTGTPRGTLYTGSILLPWSANVKARAYSSGQWSALNEAVFTLDATPSVRVSEIHFHPAPPTGVETNYDEDGFEFIELVNAGTQTVGLAGLAFTNGAYFRFAEGVVGSLAPGERAVVVNDLPAFKARCTNWASIKIAGEFTGKWWRPGSLDNGGERLSLCDGLGRTLQSFSYDGAWYPNTDGGGFSLERLDPAADLAAWSNSAAWRPSINLHGSPGVGPGDFWLPGDVLISELLSHQDVDNPGDWIELWNVSSNTVDLRDWYVSDDAALPAKLRITQSASIPPGGRTVLTEHALFGTIAGGASGFALSELGETLHLSSGTNGVITGYRATQTFRAAENGIALGRYVKSDGAVDFTALSTNTPGSANAYPLVAPVVISEVMYQPADSNAFEYVELYNRSASNVPLYNVAWPSHTWSLDDAVDYVLPTGLVLAATNYLRVIPTDEASFRACYPDTPAGVMILGPWRGKLANEGDSVELNKPGDPEPLTGEAPKILVDRVEYGVAAPWPAGAAGDGAALDRRVAGEYGNDVINWSASFSAGTPGRKPDDADYDGMPNNWEAGHALNPDSGSGGSGAAGDPDGDGFSNLQEYLADTHPTNGASRLAIIDLAARTNGAELSWIGGTAATQVVERRLDLLDTNEAWAVFFTNVPPTAITNVLVQDGSGTGAFYRIKAWR
jgi:hypothetical protein